MEIIVERKDIPSQLEGSPSESFAMRAFTGKEILEIGDATLALSYSDRIRIMARVVLSCFDKDDASYLADHLTPHDLSYLLAIQWKQAERDLVVQSACPHPIYSVEDASGNISEVLSLDETTESEQVAVDTCAHVVLAKIAVGDMQFLRCTPETLADKPVPFLRLLPLSYFLDGDDADTRTQYLRGCFDIDDMSEVTAKQLADSVAWLNRNQHGVVNTHTGVCLHCGRASQVTWEFSGETFVG